VGSEIFNDDLLGIDNPNKYGKDSFDDISELASGLTGGRINGDRNPAAGPKPSRTDEVDASFWDAVRNSTAKYGSSD
jgi:hypothetical protein